MRRLAPARRSLLHALLVVATVMLAALMPSPASAGTYHAYACQLPNGAAIPATDWAFERSANEAALPLGQDLCATDGYAALEFGSEPTTAGSWTGWGLTLPTGLKATLMVYYRWNQLRAAQNGVDDSAHPAAEFMYGQTKRWYDPSNTIPEWCYAQTGCTGYGWPNVSTVGGPRIAADFPGGASFVGFALRCRTDTGQVGGSCGGRPGGRALERVLGIDVTVRDDAAPIVGSATGTLTEAGPRSKTVSFGYPASDLGGGIYFAVLELDRQEVARYTPAGGSSCRDAGALANDPHEFLRVQPCPASANVGFDVDTTKLAEGSHRVTSYVIDAAGNRSAELVRDFVVDNAPAATPNPPPAPSPAPTVPATPLANGSGGDRGSARLRSTQQRTIRAKFGSKSAALTGRLLDDADRPIAGASLDVFERLTVPGAPWVPVTSLTTSADGGFRYSPQTTASRTVRIVYSAAVGAPTQSSLDLALIVTAGMSITAKPKVVPRRGLITLTGRVRIDALPPSGTWIEIQVRQGKAWRTVGSRKVAKDGTWLFRHRLKTAKNATLAFRARLRPASDLASAEATTRVARVVVR